jgi:hypothetical protein
MFRFKGQIAEDDSREAIACYFEEPRSIEAWFLRPEMKFYLYSLAGFVRSLFVFKICTEEVGHFCPEKFNS